MAVPRFLFQKKPGHAVLRTRPSSAGGGDGASRMRAFRKAGEAGPRALFPAFGPEARKAATPTARTSPGEFRRGAKQRPESRRLRPSATPRRASPPCASWARLGYSAGRRRRSKHLFRLPSGRKCPSSSSRKVPHRDGSAFAKVLSGANSTFPKVPGLLSAEPVPKGDLPFLFVRVRPCGLRGDGAAA